MTREGRSAGKRYREVRRILHLAGDRSGRDLDLLLARECGDDRSLAAEVRGLLEAPGPDTGDIFDAGRTEPPPGAEPPASLGPFRVLRELGRGGMGIVYEAVDERFGRTVAIKEVYPHLLASPRIADRFAREADIGRRIDHPNVVRTLGHERIETTDGPRDLLVTEYVEGRTLRGLGESLGPLSEALLRELARQIASGLAAIHAAGVVHRDLKPENILVTNEQRVRIMDLGVARLREASVALTREGEFVGSLLYAAPEQCRGEEAGPAADLYALGVVLYELATGLNPFSRSKAAGVFTAQLESRPPLLDEADAAFSPFLAAVVAELLAKKPSDRFSSAEEVLIVLAEGEASDWWRSRVTARGSQPSIRFTLPVARELPFLGRADALDLMRRAWHEAREGHGSTLLVEGEAGLGKTRLADAFVGEVGGGETSVLAGVFSASGGICGVTEALLNRFDEGIEAELVRRLDIDAEVAATFARLARGEAAETNRDAFTHFCGRLLRSLAEESPVVWVLDDAHFASPAGRAAMESLARAAAGSRALVLLTARPTTGDDSGNLAAELARAGPFRKIGLSRLEPGEVERLLRAAFGSEVTAAELARPITERSEGVPFFVLEMIAALREGGFLRQTPAGEWVVARPIAELGLPGAARELLAARVGGLARSEREILDVAAVSGTGFDAETVAVILGRPLVGVLQGLAEMQRRGGLVAAHGRRFRFDHSLLADYLYDSLPELLRDEYHGLLADAARARGGEKDGAAAAFLARHYLRSRRPREALPYLLDALDHLSGVHRNEDFLRTAAGALDTPGLLDDEMRAKVRLRTCPVLFAGGRGADVHRAAEEGRRIAGAIGDTGLRSEAHMHLGIAAAQGGRIPEAAAHFRASRDLARAAGDPHRELGAATHLGVTMIRRQRLAAANEQLRAALGAAREIGDRGAELLALVNLATLDHRRGEVAAARAQYLAALDLARSLGRKPVESYVESCLGLLAWNTGEFEEAVGRMQTALDIGTEIGNRPAQRGALAHLAVVEHSRGNHRQALRFQERLLEIRREDGDRTGEALSLAARGESKLWLGAPGAARTDLEASLAIGKDLADPLCAAEAWLALSELEWNEGDRAAARAAAEQAHAIVGDAGEASTTVGCALLLARLDEEEGDFDAARRRLEAVRDQAEEGGQSGLRLLRAVRIAALPGGDPEALAAELPELERRAPHHYRTEARFLLWRVTGDLRHLVEARRLAREARERAGAAHREAMLENIRLHREIEAAWFQR